ncbi:MAG: formylglycine-generating enzyme family protein, partial [Kiritimatiellae bacterium]|nr:formylglycine-generating enzyme family protein [Kiritimatiellia bacterium]
GHEYVLPATKLLHAGGSIGPFKVRYSEDGKWYEGTFKAITVDWRGSRTLFFPLKEYVEPKHGDRKTLTLPGGATMEMIYCGSGNYAYGDDNVRLRMDHGFWMGKYEVTQAQWKSVMKDSPARWKGDDLPVECVTWDECQEFLKRVNEQLDCGARLPTEHEWEYACRAGTSSPYSWGGALNGDKANCDGNYPDGTAVKGRYLARTTPVGDYGANPWGFCDMHGNVWEWCQDNYEALDDRRVLRGGGWGSHARKCRSACRSWLAPGYRDSFYGFRMCCSAGPRE